MISVELIKGSELENKLNQEQIKEFKGLVREYFDSVYAENSALVDLIPPRGIRDVKEQILALDQGKRPNYKDNYLIAKDEDSVAGFLSFIYNPKVLCETHMVVGQKFGGKGIGTELLKEFILLGKKVGVKELRIYNFTVGGYATFRKAEKILTDPKLVFENVSSVKYKK